jgi:flagellar biosynthesis protein FlhF
MMNVKLFHAETMHEAIRAIKAELGPDAVILSSKRVRQGSLPFGLFRRPLLEVTAAVDRDAKEFVPIPPPDKPAIRREAAPAASAPAQESSAAFQDALSAAFSTSGAAGLRSSHSALPAPVAALPRRSLMSEHVQRLKKELYDLHQRLNSSFPDDASTPSAGFPDPIARAYRKLMAQGLRSSSADSLCRALCRQFTPEKACAESEIQEMLHRLLVEPIRVSGPLLNPGDGYNVAMFVGPSGVGKTTAIVKLAAYYSLEEHKSVVLITLDSCRMAAVEHLRTYTNVLGVGLETAQTAADVIACIRRHRGANLILIDTPGFGTDETARLNNLAELKDSYGPVETHLVLSSNTRMQDLRRTLARYDVFAPSRLLFTRLDETEEYGNLFELAYQTTLPLSYWGTGQRVPEDLELAQPERLADLLLERASSRFISPGLSSSVGRNLVVSLAGTTPQFA